MFAFKKYYRQNHVWSFSQMVETCLSLNSIYMIVSGFAYIPKLIIVYIIVD
jgi:hypothetical protein